jgi:hypothetical protein
MSTHAKRNALLGLSGLVVAAGVVGLLGASTSSCGASAANTPIRTFDRAQRTDTICLHVLNGDGFNIPAVSEPQEQCAPVPENVNGVYLEYHLYALVTQSAKGQLAAVDLTAGFVVDTNKATPGTDFLPVGALPTDVAVTEDGKWVFVPAADPFKPAIYAIPGTAILGDSQELGAAGGVNEQPPTLTKWPVCGLPQAPGQMKVVNRPDGSYELAVVLPGDTNNPAKLVTINPNPLEDGTIAPGSLAPCPITSTVVLGSAGAVAMASTQPTWSDGVDWLDGGAPPEAVPGDTACGTTETGTTTTSDGGSGTGTGILADAGGVQASDAGSGSTGVISTGGVANVPHGTALAMAGNILYVGDSGLPLIHVIDVSVPGAARELAPLVATSITTPNQKVTIKDLAVSPVTSAFQRFLYAVDGSNGSVIVYDVSDPVNSPHVPLTRPHPEVNPFQPPDRLTFPSPVAAVAFVQHDRFLQRLTNSALPLTAYKSGLICNPNPNAGPSSNLTEDAGSPDDVLGAYYRADVAVTNTDLLIGPTRLRGIFGFVTLTNGTVEAVDVDDWDAPCRRPDPMAPSGYHGISALASGPRSSIAPPQPDPSSSADLDPYHVPVAFDTNSTTGESPVTLESFYPVSAPHRARSAFYLRNDPVNGIHQPYLNGVPQLFVQSAPITIGGAQSQQFPILLPTDTAFVDPTYNGNAIEPNPVAQGQEYSSASSNPVGDAGTTVLPAVRIAWEDPSTQVDQDWTVTYEGALPGISTQNQLAGVVSPVGNTVDLAFSLTQPAPGDDTTGILSIPSSNGIQLGTDGGTQGGALFCRLGVEDRRLGLVRAQAADAARQAAGLPVDATGDNLAGDYVQIADDILSIDDPYWTEDNSCWDPSVSTVDARWNSCNAFYGFSGDQSIARDFPILEAYDDHLVIGRYGYPDGEVATTANRTVVGADPSNAAFLRQARCCFHGQFHMAVRTGGEWVTVGSVSGYLHHIVPDPSTNACVSSCEPRQVLLESRTLATPRPDGSAAPVIDRNSPLAMRNPMFSFVLYNGQTTTMTADGGAPMTMTAVPSRDEYWKFTTRGEFVGLNVNIAATDTSVDPQSMHFIDSLGQLAVVDGANQGLVLIDLNTIAFSHTPYF